MSPRHRSLYLFAALLLMTATAFGQATTSNLTGTVTNNDTQAITTITPQPGR